MTAGSVLAVPATLAIAAAPNLWWFGAAWVAAGVAMAADGGGSCDNIKPKDIAAPIQSGKIQAHRFLRLISR